MRQWSLPSVLGDLLAGDATARFDVEVSGVGVGDGGSGWVVVGSGLEGCLVTVDMEERQRRGVGYSHPVTHDVYLADGGDVAVGCRLVQGWWRDYGSSWEPLLVPDRFLVLAVERQHGVRGHLRAALWAMQSAVG